MAADRDWRCPHPPGWRRREGTESGDMCTSKDEAFSWSHHAFSREHYRPEKGKFGF